MSDTLQQKSQCTRSRSTFRTGFDALLIPRRGFETHPPHEPRTSVKRARPGQPRPGIGCAQRTANLDSVKLPLFGTHMLVPSNVGQNGLPPVG